MHLIATYFPFLMHCALSTSENVPSPFLATRRYSAGGDGGENEIPDLGRKFSGFFGSSGSRPWGAEEPAGAGRVGLERWVIAIDRPDRRDG